MSTLQFFKNQCSTVKPLTFCCALPCQLAKRWLLNLLYNKRKKTYFWKYFWLDILLAQVFGAKPKQHQKMNTTL